MFDTQALSKTYHDHILPKNFEDKIFISMKSLTQGPAVQFNSVPQKFCIIQ